MAYFLRTPNPGCSRVLVAAAYMDARRDLLLGRLDAARADGLAQRAQALGSAIASHLGLISLIARADYQAGLLYVRDLEDHWASWGL